MFTSSFFLSFVFFLTLIPSNSCRNQQENLQSTALKRDSNERRKVTQQLEIVYEKQGTVRRQTLYKVEKYCAMEYIDPCVLVLLKAWFCLARNSFFVYSIPSVAGKHFLRKRSKLNWQPRHVHEFFIIMTEGLVFFMLSIQFHRKLLNYIAGIVQ